MLTDSRQRLTIRVYSKMCVRDYSFARNNTAFTTRANISLCYFALWVVEVRAFTNRLLTFPHTFQCNAVSVIYVSCVSVKILFCIIHAYLNLTSQSKPATLRLHSARVFCRKSNYSFTYPRTSGRPLLPNMKHTSPGFGKHRGKKSRVSAATLAC